MFCSFLNSRERERKREREREREREGENESKSIVHAKYKKNKYIFLMEVSNIKKERKNPTYILML